MGHCVAALRSWWHCSNGSAVTCWRGNRRQAWKGCLACASWRRHWPEAGPRHRSSIVIRGVSRAQWSVEQNSLGSTIRFPQPACLTSVLLRLETGGLTSIRHAFRPNVEPKRESERGNAAKEGASPDRLGRRGLRRKDAVSSIRGRLSGDVIRWRMRCRGSAGPLDRRVVNDACIPYAVFWNSPEVVVSPPVSS